MFVISLVLDSENTEGWDDFWVEDGDEDLSISQGCKRMCNKDIRIFHDLKVGISLVWWWCVGEQSDHLRNA